MDAWLNLPYPKWYQDYFLSHAPQTEFDESGALSLLSNFHGVSEAIWPDVRMRRWVALSSLVNAS